MFLKHFTNQEIWEKIMAIPTNLQVERHLRTHSMTSEIDRAAVSTLKTFLISNGKINPSFSENDKWPNIDGTFEFVSDPKTNRRPIQNFFVQIKGTYIDDVKKKEIKYCLQGLGFPAFIYNEVTLDPGILFLVVNPNVRGKKRVFWKYMSTEFINSIDFEKNSVTITFSADEEIKDTDDSVNEFCKKLEVVVENHSFVKKLEDLNYSREDIIKVIQSCDEQITESIDMLKIINETRDNVSKRILHRLYELCMATLILNSLEKGEKNTNLRLAWEQSTLDIKTKYLSSFLRMLQYIGKKIPDEGQSERLMLKYYNFMWQIREDIKKKFGFSILNNLESFPLKIDEVDKQYYISIVEAIKSVTLLPNGLRPSIYYVQKKTPFYVGKDRYYELTLQLAGVYATKYNRVTAYTKEDISTNYAIQIGYQEAVMKLWEVEFKIKIITNWRVSIDPSCLNKLGKILGKECKLNSKYGEYIELMGFLTRTGIDLLELIDFKEIKFSGLIDSIYSKTNTSYFKEILIYLKNKFSNESTVIGKNVIRYLLLHLKEETIESVLPKKYDKMFQNKNLYLSSKCYPFEKNPIISNLAGSKTSGGNNEIEIVRVAGYDIANTMRLYVDVKNLINKTGEIYFAEEKIAGNCTKKEISEFNRKLDDWERRQGYKLEHENGLVYITSYERDTIFILKSLLEFSNDGNKGQQAFNQNYIKKTGLRFSDEIKERALTNVFVDSKVLIIYGAAGTGKTTLINYISNLMNGRRKLFLTKTHTALQNLKRRIENPGINSDFISIDSFTKKVELSNYDLIFVDESGTIDNRTMVRFFKKLSQSTLVVLAGDIYQLESIDFGNWFFYAKDIVKDGAKVELLNTWRTQEQGLISLWREVRNRGPLITEKLAIDGPFSEDIGPNILRREDNDEVVLCLNYDGKFGLNNINNYFQNANKKGEAVVWQEWTYKIGDPILFNETKRFSVFYNNLKGNIVDIVKESDRITFTIDIETIITEMDCSGEDLQFVGIFDDNTRIKLTVFADRGGNTDNERELSRMRAVVPFQLAYAVSIHKSQGLEYNSVKIIIPSGNSEKITHGIFYTAITRAKKKLKIFWSSETMNEVVASFNSENRESTSLKIVKSKLFAKTDD